MRIFIPDMPDFFKWMDEQSLRYVILRGFEGFLTEFPSWGAKEDVDLYIEDAAIQPIYERYGHVHKKKGVKCDVYSVSGKDDSGYLGHPYYPSLLGEAILENRILYKNLFYTPNEADHLVSLIYHITYHKAEVSKFDMYDQTKASVSKYYDELKQLMDKTNIKVEMTLWSFYEYLKQQDLTISYEVLSSYIQNDFKHHRKDFFLALICNDIANGEMNLYFIRAIAFKHNKDSKFLAHLKKNNEIVFQKQLPFFTRLTKMKHIRGNKWRRGGKPYMAVITFDKMPVNLKESERVNQPYVLNRNQFLKQLWREEFVTNNNVKKSANPIHSTDNEAEAIGHFPLLFTNEEQEEIFQKLKNIRLNKQSNA